MKVRHARPVRRRKRLVAVAFVSAMALLNAVPNGAVASGVTSGTATLKLASLITVTSSPSVAPAGADVTLSATVAEIPGNPFAATGTVTFHDGAVVLGGGVLNGQTATWTGSFASGTHTITASYTGDSSYEPGMSGGFALDVSAEVPVLGVTVGADDGKIYTDGAAAGFAVAATSSPTSLNLPNIRYRVSLSGIAGLTSNELRLEELNGATWTPVALTDEPAAQSVNQAGSLSTGAMTAILGNPLGVQLAPGTTRSVNLRLTVRPGAPVGNLQLLTTLEGSNDAGVTFTRVLTTRTDHYVVSRLATTTSVSASSVVTSALRTPVLLTSYVASSAATGTVTFADNGVAVGSSLLGAGRAAVSVSLAGGLHLLTASYAGDASIYAASSSAAQSITVSPPGGSLHTVRPARILDTRIGNGAPRRDLAAGASLKLQVTGRGGIPAGSVMSAVLNMDVVHASASGALAVYADGGPAPSTSSLSFNAGVSTPGMVMPLVSTTGAVTITNRSRGPISLVADVSGWFSSQLDSVGPAGRYNPLAAARVLDTRGRKLAAGRSITTKMTGRAGVPSTGVSAVILNVTATNPAGNGYLIAYPTAPSVPPVATLVFTKGKARSTRVIVGLGTNGSVNLYNSRNTAVGLVVDVEGWFTDATSNAGGGTYVPLVTPQRLLVNAKFNPRTTKTVQFTGKVGIPARSSLTPPIAVISNITAITPDAGGSLTVYQSGGRPGPADLSFIKRQTVSNTLSAKLGGDGAARIYSPSGHVYVSIDVFGWFA